MDTIKITNLDEVGYAMKESLRELKTNIAFCGKDIKSLLLTSNSPNEGKSTTVFNLARSFADSKKSVLIIDTDMRKSVLVGRLGAVATNGKSINGLSHYITGQASLDEVIYATSIPRVFIIFAGPAVPNPTELLETKEFSDLIKFGKDNFDYVIVDTPPTGAAIDAAVVGKVVDGAIIVIEQKRTSGKEVMSVKRTLEASGVKILGAVLSKVKREHVGYGNYYGNYYGRYDNDEA